MTHNIKKICVIGSGTMGSGIAAQAANAGIPVLLLDIVKDPHNRNAVTQAALAGMLKAQPAAFMSPQAAKLVECGNLEDDLAKVAECDWIIEAIIERLDIKQALYARLEEVRRDGTAISSNTSTITLALLTEGRSAAFKRDFFITHFFNPPRYMRLLEIVHSAETSAELLQTIRDFSDRALGKSIVICKDTPGFIANRVGTYWLQEAIGQAFKMKLKVEEVDAIIGKPFGIPKTGIFGLVDLVGIDLMPHLEKSLTDNLPKHDPYFAISGTHPLIQKMIADGYTGRKGKGGFYRLNREKGKVKEVLDFETGEYRAQVKFELPKEAVKNLATLFAMKDKYGSYAWHVMAATLTYVAYLVPEISDTITAIDDAMKLGYSWSLGPFELIDKIGATAIVQWLEETGQPVPELLAQIGSGKFYKQEQGKRYAYGLDGQYHEMHRPEGVVLLEDIKRNSSPLLKNDSASLWDIGDGVVCFEFTSKMNTLDNHIMALLEKSIALVKTSYKAMVVYNESPNFSVGANLALAQMAIGIGMWSEVERMGAEGQATYKALKYAPFPVVGAPSGMALGGGCEILLHCDAIQAHAESYIGLVECGVGLIPGWGGCSELLHRLQSNPRMPKGPMPAVVKSFETISTATTSRSAAQAQEIGFMRPSDGITMNRDRLLADAKAKALALVEGYTPPEVPVFRLPGEAGKAALIMAVQDFQARGLASAYDVTVAEGLANILTGGDTDITQEVSEAEMLALEVKNFNALMHNDKTQARIKHTLETGKPLRN